MKVRDGQIIDQSSTLIHPPAGLDHFDGFNTWLHGINAEMVVRAPSWQQTADWIVRYSPGRRVTRRPGLPGYGD